MKRLEHQLRRYCKVVSVDEFRTSKLHKTCRCEMQHKALHKHPKKNQAGAVKDARVYSVLFCSNKSCHGIAVDRDRNAAQKTLALLKEQVQSGTRPRQFCRGFTEECLAAPCPDKGMEVAGQPVHSGIVTCHGHT